jgi:integral membrane protein
VDSRGPLPWSGNHNVPAQGELVITNPVSRFRFAAVAEAASWIGLLIGMYFKHVAGTGELGVKIFGPIHGVIFLAYVITGLAVARSLHWNRHITTWAMLASIPPLGSLLFERWATRTERLA